MPIKVLLKEIIANMKWQGDSQSHWLNTRTGETLFVDEEFMDEGDREKLPDVEGSPDWIQLPTKFDIHEWEIMRDFCMTVEDGEKRDDLLDAIHGSGAFRMFRATAGRLGILDDWYRFRDETIERMAINWLEEAGINYSKDE